MKLKSPEELLANWLLLTIALMQMDEQTVWELLEYESAHRARVTVLIRLYNRFSKLRGQREKSALARKARG